MKNDQHIEGSRGGERVGDTMRHAAVSWRGQFFQMRQWDRLFFMAGGGLWIYPALVREGRTVLWLHLMLAVRPARWAGALYVLPPQAVVWTQPNTCGVERYQRLHEDNDRPIGIYPWRALQRMTIPEFAAAETRLMLEYPHAQRVFAERGRVPADFARTYRQINHPAAFKYLRAWAPKFVAALHRNGGRVV